MDELMAIGEFSRLSGLSLRRLRTYAASGLLAPSAVDSETGYRYYLPGQERDARLIDLLRSADVPIADIATFLATPSLASIDRWSEQVAADADRRARALDAAKRLIAADVDVTEPMNPQEDTVMITMHATGVTQTGAARAVNEDAFLVGQRLAAVADGMGGHPGGERAAGEALRTLQTGSTPSSVDELKAVLSLANRRVWEDARSDPELEGMGTTICAAAVVDGGVAVANIGDSRCYLLRDGVLSLVTADHTVTAELVERGEISDDDARRHPHRHVLTRSVGVGPHVEADVVLLMPTDGDRILLCTDGLATLRREQLQELLAVGEPSAAASNLVAAAADAGAEDDIAVVVADIATR